MERARFSSLVFACYTLGFSFIAPTIQAVGLARTMYFGCAASVVRNAINALAATRCACVRLQSPCIVVSVARFHSLIATNLSNCTVRSAQLHANILVLGWTRAIPYVALKTANMQVTAPSHALRPSTSKRTPNFKSQNVSHVCGLVWCAWCVCVCVCVWGGAVRQAGVAAGMAQGELQGCLNNMQTVVRIFSPLLWSRLYSVGSARGQSSAFHLGVSVACFLQLILSIYADLDGEAAARKNV